jgi:hypothetical protein
MKAACSPEAVAQCHIPEDTNHQLHSCENPKACKVNKCLCCSCGDIIKMETQVHIFWFTFPVGEQAH